MDEIAFEPLLSYRDIKHSLKFLSFFSYYTTPIYKFDEVSFLRDFLPILLWVQGLVYKADYEIEKNQKAPPSNQPLPWLKWKAEMINLLKQLNLYSTQIEDEANHLAEYWDLENEMMRNATLQRGMLDQAIQQRASDVLILHYVCQKVANIELSPEIWECIQLIEVIRDIEADLRQYYDDLESGDFNIYIMFIRFYGSQAKDFLSDELARRQSLLEMKVGNLPVPEGDMLKVLLSRYYEKRPSIRVPDPLVRV